MGTFDDVRKLFQDFLAPELRAIAEKVDSLCVDQGHVREEIRYVRGDMSAMELRILNAIEQAKTEVLFPAKVAELRAG